MSDLSPAAPTRAVVVCIYCLDACDVIDLERAPFTRIKPHPALTPLVDHDGVTVKRGPAAVNRALLAIAALPDDRPPCPGSLTSVRQL